MSFFERHESIDLSEASEEEEDTSNSPTVYRTFVRWKKIPGFGLLMALLSGMIFAVSALTVEFTPRVDRAFTVVYISVVELIVYVPIAMYNGHAIQGEYGERKYLLLRAVFGFFALIATFYALTYTNFSNVTTILFSGILN